MSDEKRNSDTTMSIVSEKVMLSDRSVFSHLKGSKIIHKSLIMTQLMRKIQKIAQSEAPVLILGESGTGKELIAREIHRKSVRCKGAFIPINCGSLHKELLEGELFGYEKGAYTGAFARKIGLAELAHGGTLFLDEIGELNIESQAKLLRFLQENELFRLGGRSPIKVDVRLISATNKDLEKQMSTGLFREDLYYRINAVSIKAPPLRNRKEDILLLVDYFLALEEEKRNEKNRIFICSKVVEAMNEYHWPGNIRELQSFCKQMSIFCEKNKITMEELGGEVLNKKYEIDVIKEYDPSIDLEAVEKIYILKALRFFEWNKTKAAGALGITLKTLYNKLYGYKEFERLKTSKGGAKEKPLSFSDEHLDQLSKKKLKGSFTGKKRSDERLKTSRSTLKEKNKNMEKYTIQ